MAEPILTTVVEPIARQSYLGEVAYQRLKDIIIRGAFPPNEKMTVRSVAAALGVSTTPARDAVNRLLSEGALVNAGPKTVVLPVLTMDSLEEIAATRNALEGLAAERATQFIGRDDIVELERLQKVINKALDEANYREVLRANYDFHFLIYRCSNWPRLVSMIETQWLRIGPSLNDLYPDFAQTRKGVSNHMAAIAAFKKKSAVAARKAIEQDIKDGFQRLSALVRSRAKAMQPTL
jgi:DNA-binding GntR family transcriptional regulator